MFQFPSNGKVYSKHASDLIADIPYWVSIPFKRESVFKDLFISAGIALLSVSIPFKRESVFKVKGGLQFPELYWFQFPSNGKVYSKLLESSERIRGAYQEFQFPSNGKVYPKINIAPARQKSGQQVSIPFKREVYPKSIACPPLASIISCFNSLQTGKCIQSGLRHSNQCRAYSFNSLQTGKCIQRVPKKPQS